MAQGREHISEARSSRAAARGERGFESRSSVSCAVVRALKAVGFTGTMRPDHAPSMAGETNATPGYEMLGRLYAAGYLRGLMQAT